VGTILSEAGASFQVEAAHGKRSKIKSGNVLLRFDGQPLGAFMAERRSSPTRSIRSSSGKSRRGGGRVRRARRRLLRPRADAAGAAAVVLRLHASPVYFYKRGKGRYLSRRGKPARGARGLERKRRQQEQVDAWAADLEAGRIPPEIAEKLDTLLFKPDKTSLEWRALDQAASQAGLAPPKLLARAGALAGPEDYFLRRFAFEFFPRGTGFSGARAAREPRRDCPRRACPRSRSTTPRRRRSTTRFPSSAIRTAGSPPASTSRRPRCSSGGPRARDGGARAAFHGVLPRRQDHDASRIRRDRGDPRGRPARSRRVALSRNRPGHARREERRLALRVGDDREQPAAGRARHAPQRGRDRRGRVEGSHGEDLLLLWRIATRLKAARGAADERAIRADYTIRVAEGRVAIELRPARNPVDTLVAELMIHANATWGRMLADQGLAAMYRNQKGGKTRMEVDAGAHEWLGVSHYAWSSSPLRRFSTSPTSASSRRSCARAARRTRATSSPRPARDFEAAYDAYAEHQRLLERYWTLRYLEQEAIPRPTPP
jgi:exoribonuclease-2